MALLAHNWLNGAELFTPSPTPEKRGPPAFSTRVSVPEATDVGSHSRGSREGIARHRLGATDTTIDPTAQSSALLPPLQMKAVRLKFATRVGAPEAAGVGSRSHSLFATQCPAPSRRYQHVLGLNGAELFATFSVLEERSPPTSGTRIGALKATSAGSHC